MGTTAGVIPGLLAGVWSWLVSPALTLALTISERPGQQRQPRHPETGKARPLAGVVHMPAAALSPLVGAAVPGDRAVAITSPVVMPALPVTTGAVIPG